MKASQSLLAAFGLVSIASAGNLGKRWDNGTVYTTEVVTAYTTYCPSPTTVVQNNQTYTVTEATTLTITNCPCTIIGTSAPYTPPVEGTAPPAASATPVPTGIATQTTQAPVQVTGGAVALGSSFGALVLGGALAVML